MNEEKKQKKNIAQLGQIDLVEKELQLQKTTSILKNLDSVTDDEMFKYICTKAKFIINQIIKYKLQEITQKLRNQLEPLSSIYQEPIGIVFKKYPTIIDFDNKRDFFKYELKMLKSTSRYGGCRVKVRRSSIF